MKNDFRNRRRNYYIKKEFQRNFILKFCALVIAGAILSGAIIYAMSTATVTTTFENLRLTIKSTADYILPTLFFASVVVVVSIGIATIFITLFTSHKIGGALYAIEKHVDEVAAGNLKTEFRLRAGDEIKPLAVGLGLMVRNLRDRIKDVKDAASELEAVIEARGGGDALPDIRSKLDKLKSTLRIFNT